MNPDKPSSYVDRFPFMSNKSRANVETIITIYEAINRNAGQDITILGRREAVLNPFHETLKRYCKETYGDEGLWKQVPEAQKLVGGTIEERAAITDEQFADIQSQVDATIATLEQLVEAAQ